MKHSTNYMSTFKPTAQCQTTNPLIINILKSFIGCIFFFAAAQASAQTWQTVVDISRTSFNQSPTNSVYTVPAGGPYRYRITVKGGNGGGSNPSGNVTPTQGGRGGVFSSEYDLPTGWTLDCVAGSNGDRQA